MHGSSERRRLRASSTDTRSIAIADLWISRDTNAFCAKLDRFALGAPACADLIRIRSENKKKKTRGWSLSAIGAVLPVLKLIDLHFVPISIENTVIYFPPPPPLDPPRIERASDRSRLIDVYTRIIEPPLYLFFLFSFFFFFPFFLPLHTRDARSRATQYSYSTIILSSSNIIPFKYCLCLESIILDGVESMGAGMSGETKRI